jgi:hypothetical protein
MAMNYAVEFHDSSVERLRSAGRDAVLEMTVYVHGSTGRPGVDAGTGWYQDAEVIVSDAVLGQVPAPSDWPLDLYDGAITVDRERFGNVVPLPFDRTGQATVEMELKDDARQFVVSGSRVRINLTGTPGPVGRGIRR